MKPGWFNDETPQPKDPAEPGPESQIDASAPGPRSGSSDPEPVIVLPPLPWKLRERR